MRKTRPLQMDFRRLAGLAALAGGAGWYAALMRPVLAASALGPICGHGPLGPHCAACYAALALAAVGLGLCAAGEGRQPAAIRVPVAPPGRRPR